MKTILTAAAASLMLIASPAMAEEGHAHHAAAKLSTGETTIGALMENQAAWAIVVKHIPALVGQEGMLEMAKPMTFRAIQAYAADQFTNEKLDAIDADLAKLG